MERTTFSPKWYSHKFHGPGLRYELGICIRTGDIVWAHGRFPCGEWPDLRLARPAFILGLQEGERVIADRGYNDNYYFEIPNGYNDEKKKEIMARHETLNHRIKQFSCLQQRFRHELYLHPLYFNALVNLKSRKRDPIDDKTWRAFILGEFLILKIIEKFSHTIKFKTKN